MIRKRFHRGTAAAIGIAALFALPASLGAQTPAAVAIDNDDIGGVVRGPNGPEAGVWVIAETRDLPTRFTRSVVTDDQGRYVLPDLPKAKYRVWVRGYGLVDSQKVESEPGRNLDLTAVPAPDERAAAEYYPAIYWYSMLKIPAADQFGGNSDIPANVKQRDWLNLMKNNGCIGCHQLGQASTRTIPKAFGDFKTGEEAWIRRTQSGQAGELMVNILAGQLGGAPYKYFGDWTDRIAKGELPHHKPARPSGVERNVVVTTWDWSDEKHYLHDLAVSDKRDPTVNGYGPVFGQPEYSTDLLPILNPVSNTVTRFKAPVRDAGMPMMLGPGHAAMQKPLQPSAYWGEEAIWDTHVNNHDSMIDGKGRMWLAASVRDVKNPAFCQKGSDHPSARLTPVAESHRQLAVLDPKTMKYSFIDTCFTTHHLNFAKDANDTLWASSGGGSGVVGWFNTKLWDETGDAEKAQGWTALIVDTNGNGKRDDYVEQGKPLDGKDMRIRQVFYAVMVSPADGSIWGTLRASPGSIVRLDPGSNPPETALAEIYNVPMPGFGPRGADIDSQGVVWVSLASGHMGAFDRRKCKVLNGPTATGNHCPEGWSFYQYPGPGFDGIGENSAESSYYSWVDQHNTFGLGNDVPVSTANLQDGLVALKDGKMILLKVPYPTGFYAKGLDGRIDDPNAGWKGRGLWTSSGDRVPWLQEGGKGMMPMAVHFQLRPDPLAH
ncbi:MAG: carboxypeptidase regulatory-like domain-containing protein [Bradyrhizobiaceae bacterium]|nr:carboxypeptidase regulatory-like domain-containing protein [Bradyrhizobiaceae bacterium]